MTERRTYRFLGRVQGVGFRVTTASLARNHAVAGTVQNLANGSVELVVEGEASEIDQFVESIKQTMVGYIERTEQEKSGTVKNLREFRILR